MSYHFNHKESKLSVKVKMSSPERDMITSLVQIGEPFTRVQENMWRTFQ